MDKRVSSNKLDKSNKKIEKEDGVKLLNEVTKANSSLTLLSYNGDAVSIHTNLRTNSYDLLKLKQEHIQQNIDQHNSNSIYDEL